ncbi:MAG: MgtC/SapB family protein [Myxococcales bacterium]|nr:MgtC/SapB family protein [Myxococcales bacterium]
MIDAVIEALRAEFSDVSDPAQITRIVTRLLLAAALGGALGYEREKRGKAAGLRTHMLVSMGAALFVLVPQQAGMAIGDTSRVIQGIITGVGFLGAGAIIKGRSEENVQGLTTAAGVWLTAAIGIACGLGREVTAVLSTVLALLVLTAIPRLVGKAGVGDESDRADPSDRTGASDDADEDASRRRPG